VDAGQVFFGDIKDAAEWTVKSASGDPPPQSPRAGCRVDAELGDELGSVLGVAAEVALVAFGGESPPCRHDVAVPDLPGVARGGPRPPEPHLRLTCMCATKPGQRTVVF
jgi:hypothetical protein